MGQADQHSPEDRVLVLAPTRKDAALSQTILANANIAGIICPDLAAVCRELEAGGAAAAVLTEEALRADQKDCLAGALQKQPPWSDLPLIVLTGGGADSAAALRALETLGNTTLLERPVRVATLVSTVRVALRARQRQYQVRDMLAERARAEAALKEADQRKNEFLAMLGHELRNPLAPIRNALHILRRQCAGDSVVAGLAEMMARQVGHMVRLVDDLLDVARITRGKVELRWEPVDLATVMSRAVEAVRPCLEERQHCLEVVYPGEPLHLEADAARLEQVLNNLLTNAGKYTNPGGHICLSAAREQQDVVLRVRDSGIGIRPEMVTRIFELFTQADRVTGRLQEGLGLGLTLVRSLVEMHGGTVTASSAGPGQGSEFIVRLPLPADLARPAEPLANSAGGPAGRPLRILAVDDNADAADSLALWLRLEGHDVRVAHDGPAALESARTFVPEVILLDIGLPGMDGHEVARRLRQIPEVSGAVLVALTGYGLAEDRQRSGAAGFQAHLVKPADARELRELLSQVQNP